MPAPVFIAIADDLTGAAEIAAVAHVSGLHATVQRTLPSGETTALDPAADLVVFDTDSRLLPPEAAAARVDTCARGLPAAVRRLCFKKTDSVLRGPVAAELAAAAHALDLPRVLLAPASPSLGRTLHESRYAIDGVPLHRTAFAHDPHHPATTDDALASLAAPRDFPATSLRPGARLPARGIALADARSPADLVTWAQAVDAQTLPAGSAAFFAAWLTLRKHRPNATAPTVPEPTPPLSRTTLAGPTLVVCGSLAPAARAQLARTAAHGGLVHELTAATLDTTDFRPAPQITALLSAALAAGVPVAIAAATSSEGASALPPLSSARVTAAFVVQLCALHERRAFRHLIIEGGATAGAILQALGWEQLRVTHVWAPGVVSLVPTGAPDILLTLKPGSYPWPAALAALLHAPTAAAPVAPLPPSAVPAASLP